MRGWSWISWIPRRYNTVIPANAGVILEQFEGGLPFLCYPRECGGDPVKSAEMAEKNLLSPRMRGWSCNFLTACGSFWVIPANAGVILKKCAPVVSPPGYPRECGGDPTLCIIIDKVSGLSPRMRGWSRLGVLCLLSVQVIPANAGVILNSLTDTFFLVRYPRECGGDPTYTIDRSWKSVLSPRMRGWS